MRIHKYYKMVRVDYADSEYFRLTNVDSVAGTLTFENMSGKNLEYSTDGVNWTTADLSSTFTLSVAPNTNVYMRGNNTAIGSSSYVKHISADFNHTIGGNICSLLDKTNFSTMTSITSNAFGCLFYQDVKLISAAFNLGNVTLLESYALFQTFNGCTSLTTPPDLSNVTDIGYFGLQCAFYSCTALTTPPDLSNVTDIGDFGLTGFVAYCTSLTTPPDLSNVTSLGSNALSSAFENCTALTTPPDLSNVTSLGSSTLYASFKRCSSLTTTPDLSNVTTLGNEALRDTFAYCSKLQTVIVPNINTWNTSSFTNWVGDNAGSSAATPKQMIFQSQALLDLCPSGNSGYGVYNKILA